MKMNVKGFEIDISTRLSWLDHDLDGGLDGGLNTKGLFD